MTHKTYDPRDIADITFRQVRAQTLRTLGYGWQVQLRTLCG